MDLWHFLAELLQNCELSLNYIGSVDSWYFNADLLEGSDGLSGLRNFLSKLLMVHSLA